MTRGQRRAHGVAWLVLALGLVLASVHALAARRAAWSDAEAIRDGAPRAPAPVGAAP